MRAVTIADDRDKLRAIANTEQDARRLRRNRRFAIIADSHRPLPL
jgi:hypothetical protein